MTNRYGVIDLGTNTFHLLISEQKINGNIVELFRKRMFVQLGENGIETIGETPFQRALDAIHHFKNTLEEYNVYTIKAFGTAALRTASNGNTFINKIKQETGIQIELIPGKEEARLIHLGVIQAVPLNNENGLIMDIGGGSVEFIVANEKGVIWAQSFPIGVSVLFRQFHKSDPIASNEIDAVEKHLENILQPLFETLKKNKTPLLIGASGTFDVLDILLSKQRFSAVHSIVEVRDFSPLYQSFLNSTLTERLQMERLPESRAEMIIVAMILINFILQKANTQRISVSAYALKEGILQEMINK
jgi:exopolyphosphatase / guanosine-5'-triphosphate,3'-diphosphate pyrophosphatase